MMDFFIPFISGILAAFTPCALVMIPLILYRFIHEKKTLRPILLLSSGFTITYIFLTYILASLLASSIQNGLKIGIALLFIVLGILAFYNRINPMNFPALKDPFLFGVILVPLVIFNPCIIPFSGFLLTVSGPALLFNMILFAVGLIVPSLAFAIFGTRLINKKLFHHTSRLMSIILVISGIYALLRITSLSTADIIVISVFLILIFTLLLKVFFIMNKKADLFKLPNILLLISLVAIIGLGIFHCNHQVDIAQGVAPFGTCQANITSCAVCTQCLLIFGGTLVLGSIAIYLRKRIT